MSAFTVGGHFPDTTSPGITPGLRWPSYRSGRVLTATDLTADQQAARARDRLLGRATGHGVVSGFTVATSAVQTRESPSSSGGNTLTVNPGAGITRSGDPVSLELQTTLPLIGVLAEAELPNVAGFHCCGSTPASPTGALLPAGAYLLAVRAAERTEGGKCAGQWTVAGLEFRAIALPALTTVGGRPVTAQNRRNLLAMWCLGADSHLGTPDWGGLPAELYGKHVPTGTASLLDLTGDDLPLAVFWWDGLQIADLDLWSVRRRITEPEPADPSFGLLTGDERIASGQARFHQFTAQCNQLARENQASSTVASERFGLLPPAGFLPIGAGMLDEQLESLRDTLARLRDWLADGGAGVSRSRYLSLLSWLEQALARWTALQAGSGSGFVPEAFFGRLARFGGLIDWDLAEFALRDSWHRRPVPTTPPDITLVDVQQKDTGSGLRPDLGAHLRETRATSRAAQTPFVYYLVQQQLFPPTQVLPLDLTQPPPESPPPNGSPSQLYVFFVAGWTVGARTTMPARLLLEEQVLDLLSSGKLFGR